MERAIVLAASAIAASLALLPAAATGLSQGFAAAKASEAVGKQPEASGEITRTLLIGSAMAETSGIYGFIIALILVLINPLIGLL